MTDKPEMKPAEEWLPEIRKLNNWNEALILICNIQSDAVASRDGLIGKLVCALKTADEWMPNYPIEEEVEREVQQVKDAIESARKLGF